MKAFTSRYPAWRQLSRYGFVGVLNNFLGYLIYLLITFLGVDPKVVVALFYPVGALTAYFGHSKYSFYYRGRNTHAVLRYCIAHLVGYGTNLLLLFILSDKLKFPHQAVQALAMLVVAGILFLMMKYFVFPETKVG
jgi:putative flippase GtrA